MTGASTNAVLAVTDLFFCYANPVTENDWIVRELSLSIERGEIVSILGASGCGKTTLLNLIAGLLPPTKGKIDFVESGGAKSIGYIFQHDALFPWRTVESNLCLAWELKPKGSLVEFQQRLQGYIKLFHLSANVIQKYPIQLSGGMRQRVSIIQSLLFDPLLLLLDEPFSALDFFTKLRLETEFYELVKNEGRAAILVTHDIDEAIAISDRIFIMDNSGHLISEYKIKLGTESPAVRSPELVRGTEEFAHYYSQIWSELKAVIKQ